MVLRLVVDRGECDQTGSFLTDADGGHLARPGYAAEALPAIPGNQHAELGVGQHHGFALGGDQRRAGSQGLSRELAQRDFAERAAPIFAEEQRAFFAHRDGWHAARRQRDHAPLGHATEADAVIVAP